MADRIQARAVRRAGELLKEIEPARGANQNIRDGAGPNVITREQAAADAGLSERQRKTALLVANIPESEFERAVESADPPTITRVHPNNVRSCSCSPKKVRHVRQKRLAGARRLLARG
jgi:hypothetical protein